MKREQPIDAGPRPGAWRRSPARRWALVLVVSAVAIVLFEGVRRVHRSAGGTASLPGAEAAAPPPALVLDPLELAAVPEAPDFWLLRAPSLRGEVFAGAPGIVAVRPSAGESDRGADGRLGVLVHRSPDGGWYSSRIGVPGPDAPALAAGDPVPLGRIGEGAAGEAHRPPPPPAPGSVVAGFPSHAPGIEGTVRLRDPLEEAPPADNPGGQASGGPARGRSGVPPGIEIELAPPEGTSPKPDAGGTRGG